MTDITWTEQRVKLADLKPWPRNPRTIKQAQAERLIESFDEFGQVETVAIGPDGEVYNGHQRLQVLRQQYGDAYELDARRASRPLSEKERERLTVLLHKGAAGDWDFDTLAAEFELGDLLEWGFEPFELGLDDAEPVNEGADTEPQIDRAEELRQKWQVEPGQMWQLGEHRLICGDCTDADVVARVMGGEKANGAFTSPPYAMQRKDDYGGVPVNEYVGWWAPLQSSIKALIDDCGSLFVNIKPHCDNGQRVLYVFDLVLAMVREWNWCLIDEFCWTHQGVPGHWPNRFKNGFEPIYQFSPNEKIKFRPGNVSEEKDTAFKGKGGGLNSYYDPSNEVEHSIISFTGNVLPSNNLRLNFPSAQTEYVGHKAQFPLSLPTFFVSAYSDTGDIWLEPFCGSGTTIIACENLNRKCRAVEISPAYCAVALQRWADHTGNEPELMADD